MIYVEVCWHETINHPFPASLDFHFVNNTGEFNKYQRLADPTYKLFTVTGSVDCKPSIYNVITSNPIDYGIFGSSGGLYDIELNAGDLLIDTTIPRIDKFYI